MVSYEIRSMVEQDVPQVADIEALVFSAPWSEAAIRSELEDNGMSFYLVIVREDLPDEVIGYCGIWKIFDEGHITNIAIRPQDQGKKLGQMLLYAVIQWALANALLHLTLEVRASNQVAINLYEKAGFVKAGIRPGYYDGGGEDALLMWLHMEGGEYQGQGLSAAETAHPERLYGDGSAADERHVAEESDEAYGPSGSNGNENGNGNGNENKEG